MNDVLDPILGAERWPPMLGVVGFDGGYKSAVALAIPPEGLAAGEGEFLPGEGFGACCYNDGTCDSPITEFDCTSAMGTYQGDGTDCGSVTCTGVCCEPGCVDDTTPDGCSLDGGTFQGFGTTCADDPPPCPPTGACCDDVGGCTITTEEGCTGTYQGDDTTCDPNPCGTPPVTGACCIDNECSILSESDCVSDGGTYQGDDTTCDPNPCGCCAGFGSFDGSPGTFRHRVFTTSFSGSYVNGADTCSLTYNQTFTESYDHVSCTYSSVCTGHYMLVVGPDTFEGDPCGGGLPGGCGDCVGDCIPYIGVSPHCTDPGCSCSRTAMTCSHSASGTCGFTGNCTTSVSWVVSDECV